MFITLVRSGGFAGTRTTRTIDTKNNPNVDKEVEQAVGGLKTCKGATNPDGFVYTLQYDKNNTRSAPVTFTEDDCGKKLLKLLDKIDS